jgi:predicted DNA-binding transcriptional regulator YafY
MRDVDRLPVSYNPRTRVWRATGEIESVPTNLVSAGDRRALLFSLRAAAQMDGTPMAANLRQVYLSFLNTLPAERATNFERVMDKVLFLGPEVPKVRPEVWEVLLLALESSESVCFRYRDGAKGVESSRGVDPYGLVMRDKRWLMVGRCHRADRVLVFALHRIAAAELTDRAFDAGGFSLKEYVGGGFEGVPATGPRTKVVLELAADAPPYVRERVWHAAERRTVTRAGRLRIEFATAAVFAVEREVMAEAGWVEMVAPREARKRVLAAARRALESHKG